MSSIYWFFIFMHSNANFSYFCRFSEKKKKKGENSKNEKGKNQENQERKNQTQKKNKEKSRKEKE